MSSHILKKSPIALTYKDRSRSIHPTRYWLRGDCRLLMGSRQTWLYGFQGSHQEIKTSFRKIQYPSPSYHWQMAHSSQVNSSPDSVIPTDSNISPPVSTTARPMAKRVMKRALLAKSDVYLVMLDHRNTPTQGLDTSPAQVLMNRRTKIELPTTAFSPTTSDSIQSSAEAKGQAKQIRYFDRRAKYLPPLEKGDVVRMNAAKV